MMNSNKIRNHQFNGIGIKFWSKMRQETCSRSVEWKNNKMAVWRPFKFLTGTWQTWSTHLDTSRFYPHFRSSLFKFLTYHLHAKISNFDKITFFWAFFFWFVAYFLQTYLLLTLFYIYEVILQSFSHSINTAPVTVKAWCELC